jgi:hypothetical protein
MQKMNLFKREPKIEFFSLMPDVVKLAPIQPAANFRPTFMRNAAEELSRMKKEPNYGNKKMIHTAKCPGIYNYAKQGWVMTTWQDIVISTDGDGVNFSSRVSTDQENMVGGNLVGKAVAFHPPGQYADYVGDTPNTLRYVVKLNTPWRCVVPEGYYLQEGPLPFSDEKRFTTVTGFFSREYGVAQMNVQLLWHVMEGETLIKAGTPIAHYMLIPKKQPKLEIRAATKQDLEHERRTLIELNRTFITNRTEQKCIFAKLFGDSNG